MMVKMKELTMNELKRFLEIIIIVLKINNN
jgi:hypothetical protein